MPNILAFIQRYQYSTRAAKKRARNMSLPNSSLLSKAHSDDRPTARPISVTSSADGSTRFSSMFSRSQNEGRSSSIPRPLTQRHAYSDSFGSTASSRPSSRDQPSATTSLDLMDVLHRSEPSVVKTRIGSVLSRGMILKTDHYPSGMSAHPISSCQPYATITPGRALDLDLNVHGAPNFRSSRQEGLNVFGAAQPRTQGLRAILSILRARPNTPNPSHVVWFSTREEPIGICLFI